MRVPCRLVWEDSPLASDAPNEGRRISRTHHPRRAAAQAWPQGRSTLRLREVSEWSPAVPASTAVEAAAADQQNNKYNNEKGRGAHEGLPHIGDTAHGRRLNWDNA